MTERIWNRVLTLLARGVKDEDIVVVRYADAGVKLYSNASLASTTLVNENPKALRRPRAVRRGGRSPARRA